MSTPAATLNSIARRRHAQDEATESSSKRRAIEQSKHAATTNGVTGDSARLRARKSITKLPGANVAAVRPVESNRSRNVYEAPDSPDNGNNHGARPGPKATKTIRKINPKGKQQIASPLSNHAFGKLNEMAMHGVNFNSTNSPAKVAKPIRRANPLRRTGMAYTAEQASRNKMVKSTEEPLISKRHTRAATRSTGDGIISHDLQAQTDNNNEAVLSGIGHNEEEEELRDEYREQDPESPVEPGFGQKDQSGTARNKGKARIRPESLVADQADERESSGPISEAEEAPVEASRPHRRKRAMTEMEKRVRKEAEALRRRENAEETEASEAAKLDQRCKEFVEGIDPETLNQVGGVQNWATMGGAAKTISIGAVRKEDMDTGRAKAVWRSIRQLRMCFRSTEHVDEAEIRSTLDVLHKRAQMSFLNRDGEPRRADQTVLNLFEHLIPHAVFLLKDTLTERCLLDDRSSWQELQIITKVAINLCDTATRWRPKPSTLETGIRKHVRNNIRPALENILEAIDSKIAAFDYEESMERKGRALKKAQAEAQAKRVQKLNQIFGKLSTSYKDSSTHDQRNHEPLRAPVDVNHVHDIDDIEASSPVPVAPSRHREPHRPRPQLYRRPTTEIPAPDSNTWTTAEEQALLNGLLYFRGPDRYDRILSCSQLAEKDIDQCVARARYYKQACGNEVPEWLADV